jgi:hypothetical protein
MEAEADKNSVNASRHSRPRGRPFQPGQSGNPGGRPRVFVEIRDLARKHTREAVAVLVSIAHDSRAPAAARVAAANSLLDRAWGRPPQALEHNVSTESVSEVHVVMTEEQKAARIFELLQIARTRMAERERLCGASDQTGIVN